MGIAAKFQSQTGSIRSPRNPKHPSHCRGFNPKLVRLEVHVFVCVRHVHVGFNPKLVRLEGYKLDVFFLKCLFQSQTGSIRRILIPLPRIPLLICFNPKLVRLEEHLMLLCCIQFASFNPKLVRLEGYTPLLHCRIHCSFNPKLVRLEVAVRQQNPFAISEVSIPNWFD